MHSFVRGESYDREEVLGFLRSKQRQSGIVHGHRKHRYVAVFTGGRSGKRAGYEDGWQADGTFQYCGQGLRGNQRFVGPNKVLAEHRGVVLLFETWKPRNSWKGRQRFLGEYQVLGHEWIVGRGSRSGDRLLVFSLVPVESLMGNDQLFIRTEENVDIETLRAQAIAAGKPSASARPTRAEFRSRSASVARYVLARANGICESCREPAPFNRIDGTPFLEVHHTCRLADEGPDDILHVAGICPNCHREGHLGPDTNGFRMKLDDHIAKKERSLEEGTRPADHPAS